METCPLTSKLGTLSGTAIGSVDGQVSADGNLYLIDPSSLDLESPAILPGAAAAVALVIDDIDAPVSTNPGKILAIGGLYINNNGFNLRIDVDNIPNATTTSLRFHALSVTMTLDGDTRPDMGQPASASNPALLTNPSQCAPGVLVENGAERPYWDKFAGTGTGYFGSTITTPVTQDYPVDNCGSLPFDPHVSFSTNPSPLPASTSTTTQDFALTSDIDFNYGDSTLMSANILMPPYVSTNLPGLGSPDDECLNSSIVASDNGVMFFDYDNAECPPQARVGEATIKSPLIEGDIKADVWVLEVSTPPWLGLSVRDTTPGNPRGVNVGFVVALNTASTEYPTAEMLTPWGLGACSVTSNTVTNNRRLNKCRSVVTASVSPGMVPDMPLTSLSLTVGNVAGRLNASGNPMPKPLRTATNTDTIACRVGGPSIPDASNWLPPTGTTPTPASRAFRMTAQTSFAGWSLAFAPNQADPIPIGGIGVLGCTQ